MMKVKGQSLAADVRLLNFLLRSEIATRRIPGFDDD